MACPKCGCKVTYTYIEDDVLGLPGDQERCSYCGHIFYVDDSAEDDDEDEDQFRGATEMMVPNVPVKGRE